MLDCHLHGFKTPQPTPLLELGKTYSFSYDLVNIRLYWDTPNPDSSSTMYYGEYMDIGVYSA